ncbi:hypothetical protein ACEWPN_16925 [Yoonia sp. R2-816]
MDVSVLDRALQHRLWGKTYRSINQIIKRVTISDFCPKCGEKRGKPALRQFCEDGEWYDLSCWQNPCGHIDKYQDVIAEAEHTEAST